MRQMTVFVNLFQNLGSGYSYMKVLPEFQIESISAIEKKREDKISLYLRAYLSPAHFHFQTLAHGNKL
jgi:hypothetical protein